MKKFCFSCWSRIPLLASRCPNCISDNQSVFGRSILVILLILGLFFGAKYYHNKKKGENINKVPNIELKNNR